MNINKIRNSSFIENHLNKLVNFNNKTITYKELYNSLNIIKKTISIQNYSNKKINLCYNKLSKPKITYCLIYIRDTKEYIFNVPKIIYYDYFIDIIEDTEQIKKNTKPTTEEFNLYKKYTTVWLNCKNAISNYNEIINKVENWNDGNYIKSIEG